MSDIQRTKKSASVQFGLASLALCALLGCSAQEDYRGSVARLLNGDLSAREKVAAKQATLSGQDAWWAALLLDPNVAQGAGADAKLAATLYRRALRDGVADAGFNLVLLAIQQSVPLLPASETAPAESVEGLLKTAANGGCLPAMILLARFHAKGTGGVAKNDVLAADYYEMAALAKRTPNAEYELGLIYLSGTGRQKDVGKAVQLLTSAASSGLPEAAAELGRQTSQPTLKARWYGVAAQISPRYSALAMDSMRHLSVSEIAELTDALQVWRDAYQGKQQSSVDPSIPWLGGD